MQGEKLFPSGYIRKKPHGASPFYKTESPRMIYNKESNLREVEKLGGKTEDGDQYDPGTAISTVRPGTRGISEIKPD